MKTSNGKYKARDNWMLTLSLWDICKPNKAHKAGEDQMVSLAVLWRAIIGPFVMNQKNYPISYIG
jgi:hypothetical protein